jgi:tRNA threonylcarbamoyladenosine biosynthesis protein TsaE
MDNGQLTMDITINNLDEMGEKARMFINTLGEQRVIAFYGSMGAGKTTFIRALCQELGVIEPVTSPTFAIVNEYEVVDDQSSIHQSSIKKVFHFDFYRIKRLEEAYDMGFEDYLYSGQLCLIEWPELIEELLPDDAVRVHITVNDDGTRSVRVA